MRVRRAAIADIPIWAEMRHALWPDADIGELRQELPDILADETRFWSFMLEDASVRVAGFVEVQLRDMFDGNRVDPYPHLEALWVVQDMRRTGGAQLLLEAVEQRARQDGHRMLGSDADLDNDASHAWHDACGFAEEGRQILYSKQL